MQNEGVVSNIQTGDVLANVSLNCPVLLEKKNIAKTLDPPIFLQSDKHTRSKVTYHHEKKKTQALSWRHLAVAKQCVPLKQNKTKKKIICLLFCADVCLTNEPPCQWFEAAKLTGDRCVHWQTIGLNCTSQHHRKTDQPLRHTSVIQVVFFQQRLCSVLETQTSLPSEEGVQIGCCDHPVL